MRILLVITSLPVGGAERVVATLADRFAEAGHDVVVARFFGEAESRPLSPNVRLVDLELTKSVTGLVNGLRNLRELIQCFQPDVVNSHLIHANILVRVLRIITPMNRLVSSAHNTNEEGAVRMIAYRMTDWLTDISTNVSDEAVTAFEKEKALKKGRMLTIYNGIDTDLFRYDEEARVRLREEFGVDDAQPIVLAVGRLWKQKDYPNLVHALDHLQESNKSPCLWVAGEGPLRNEILGLAERLGVAHRVSLLGVRHDVAALMSACDVFVLSSAWEGFGLVVAEAMACERSVVATDCGGVREVMGECGFLVPPHDTDALATAIGNALRLRPAERARLGRVARERVIDRFSLDAVADKYLALYEGRWPY